MQNARLHASEHNLIFKLGYSSGAHVRKNRFAAALSRRRYPIARKRRSQPGFDPPIDDRVGVEFPLGNIIRQLIDY
jgi:hypothetical protein